MTTAVPDLSDLSPTDARLVLRVIERAGEIIEAHVPDPNAPTPEISPMATIRIEALAHLTALVRLHQHGAAYHTARGNTQQAHLWTIDAEHLQTLWKQLAAVHIN